MSQEALFKPSSKRQEQFINSKAFITVFGGAAMSGKAQPLDSKVLTPNGWKTMGELEVGDSVITPDKQEAEILSTHPNQYSEVYEFTLTNYKKVKSSTDHLWVFKLNNKQCFGDTNKITALWLKGNSIKVPVFKRKKVVWLKLKDVTTCGWTECKCISIDSEDHLYITDNCVITHNTFQGLMRFLWYVDDPLFSGYVVRKNATDFKKGGGAFEEAIRMFKLYDPKMTYTKQPMQITFSSGATINFIGLDGSAGMEAVQGIQITCAMVDEATHLSEEEITWLITRLRATSENITPCIWLTCNPDPDSFLCEWLSDYYLYPLGSVVDGELIEGRPIPERNGDVRYYLRIGNDIKWSSSYDELFNTYHKLFPVDEEGKSTCIPQSFCFIGATCLDNPLMLKKNPNYVAQLAASPRIKMERLLKGNWYAREEESGYFKRHWTPLVKEIDHSKVKRWVRAFDIAYSTPSEQSPSPDYTAAVLLAKMQDDTYVVAHVDRVQKRAGDVEDWVLDVVTKDKEYYQGNYQAFLPQDPAAGQMVRVYWAKLGLERGLALRFHRVSSQNGKVGSFQPFAASSENGLVSVLEDKEWNGYFFGELESFNGKRSTATRKDDICDGISLAFNVLATSKELPKLDASRLRMPV